MTKNFFEEIKNFPEKPGIYLMKDSSGKILYIGKAKNIKKRVLSYFTGREERYQIPFLMSKIDKIEWIVTNCETEALILEANLIRINKPPYNIDLKDDKHYPYVEIDLKETFPKINIVRRIKYDSKLYLGPYTNVTALRKSVDAANKIFGIRVCKLKLPSKKIVRPCINFDMGYCTAPCAKKISENDYRKNLDDAISFLRGKRKKITELLQQKMNKFSAELRFEDAARIRDKLNLINRENKHSTLIDLKAPQTDLDVFSLYSANDIVILTRLVFREGILLAVQNHQFKKNLWEKDDSEILFLRIYNQSFNIPDEIIIDKEINIDINLLKDWLFEKFNQKIKIFRPEAGIKKNLINLGRKNAELYNMQKNSTSHLTDMLMKVCNLPRRPATIEAFDISNLGDKYCVAAMVKFKEGKPEKNEYRNFKIKTVEGQNDFAMLMEAVNRRLTRLQKENKKFPDLLLIDGGKGQLYSVKNILDKFKNPPMIISLAKKEETVFSPYTEDGITFKSNNEVRKYLQRIRDEVHRRAITYHRKLRNKATIYSQLEQIDGVGKTTAKKILSTAGSVTRVKQLTPQELSRISNISLKLAQKIIQSLS